MSNTQEFLINILRKIKGLCLLEPLSSLQFFLVCSAPSCGLNFALSATVELSQISEYFAIELKRSGYWMDMVFAFFVCVIDTKDESQRNYGRRDLFLTITVF